jgi:hypothetical protein
MRRIAAHYIYWRQLYKMSYLELTDEGLFKGVFPLDGEIAGTEFYDGLLIPVNEPGQLSGLNGLSGLFRQVSQSNITDNVFTGTTVHLYRIHRNKIYAV